MQGTGRDPRREAHVLEKTMLVSNAVIPPTKCRSAAVEEGGDVPSRVHLQWGGGCVSLTRGPCRGWFTHTWHKSSAPGKAGRAVGAGREEVIEEETAGR